MNGKDSKGVHESHEVASAQGWKIGGPRNTTKRCVSVVSQKYKNLIYARLLQNETIKPLDVMSWMWFHLLTL